MSNSLLTINMITKEAVKLWRNTNAFIQNIDLYNLSVDYESVLNSDIISEKIEKISEKAV